MVLNIIFFLTAANLFPSIKAGCCETGRASKTCTWGLGRSDELELLRSWFRTFWITGLAVWRISAPTFLTSLFTVTNFERKGLNALTVWFWKFKKTISMISNFSRNSSKAWFWNFLKFKYKKITVPFAHFPAGFCEIFYSFWCNWSFFTYGICDQSEIMLRIW